MLLLLVNILSYILGVYSSYYLTALEPTLILIPILGLLISYLFKSKGFKLIIFGSIFFVAGFFNYQYQKPIPGVNDLAYYSPIKKVTVEGVITSEPKVNQETISFDFQPELVVKPVIFLTTGKVQVTLSDTKTVLHYGDKIELTGALKTPAESNNEGEFSYAEYLKHKGIFATILISEPKNIKVQESETLKDFTYRLIKIRAILLSPLKTLLPEYSASFLSSLVFGAKAVVVSSQIKESFSTLGLTHVLAASGMQIVLIIVAGRFLTRFCQDTWLQKILIALTVIFYMLLTDCPPSILRAGAINLLIIFLTKPKLSLDSIKVLFTGSFLLVIAEPLLVFDLGFQFSFLATFALIVVAPVIKTKLIFLPDFLSDMVAVTLAAQLMVLPLQIYHFQQFSLLFLPANLLAGIFINALTYLTILIIMFYFMIPVISTMIASVSNQLISLFLSLTSFMAEYKAALLQTAKPDLFMVLLSYVGIFVLLLLLKRKISFQLKKVSLLICCVLFSGYYVYQIPQSKLLRVDFISVGQGNATLIQTPEGKKILIDCGAKQSFVRSGKEVNFSAGEKYIVPFLKQKGISKLDIVILTHPDGDHIGGFEAIFDKIDITEIWDSGQIDNSENYSKVLELALKNNVAIKTDKLTYTEKDLSLEAYNIGFDPQVKSYNNNNALIVNLTHNQKKFLFMSDIELEGETYLLDHYYDLRADILQVGHHGSKTSSSIKFLREVQPQISVVSVGKNNIYKHPHQEVSKRLDLFSSEVYRTDEDGGVSISSDGETLKVSTHRNGSQVL